jgi:membrane protein YdbS with pleckstrin-like domain
MVAMFCAKCRAEIPPDAAFCPKCGAAVSAATAPARAATPTERMQGASAAVPQEPEQELWRGGYSAKAMYGEWAFAIAMFTPLILIASRLADKPYRSPALMVAGCVIIIVWLFVLLRLIYRQASVSYTLTNQRFLIERGLLRRVHDRVLLIDIDDVSFSQGLIERFINVGTIKLTSTDASDRELKMIGIANVQYVANLIDDARREERRKRAIYMANV